MTLAALGDLHIREASRGMFNELFAEISEKADVLLLCGDLTNAGLSSEAEILATEIRACRIPILAVLGNHDYDAGKIDEIKRLLQEHKVMMLDGDIHVIGNVGFVGAKGFCGGFDNHILTPLGEDMIKNFVYETVNEALKLENALSELETQHKIVILHYSPIRQTVEGESPEIWAFCGSSRLAEPINRLGATAVFHGHAHHGTMKGEIQTGIPVFNASYPLLLKHQPKKPYVLYEIPQKENDR